MVAQISLNTSKAWLTYGETIISNKLNHKPQARARVYKEIKEKMTAS